MLFKCRVNKRPRNNKTRGSAVHQCLYFRVTLTAQDITEIHERFHSNGLTTVRRDTGQRLMLWN
jgi:hypothetical protein